ncbi:MAG: hypothetical protein MUC60_10655 [Oscillatoria sp. Prado101]|nr:hypothetical protein [Oscillatoria sp. Prado101]
MLPNQLAVTGNWLTTIRAIPAGARQLKAPPARGRAGSSRWGEGFSGRAKAPEGESPAQKWGMDISQRLIVSPPFLPPGGQARRRRSAATGGKSPKNVKNAGKAG